MSERNYELEAAVAKHIYGHETEMLDVGFGLTLYLVNRVKRGEPVSIIGGRWERARDVSGEIVEFFIRQCPAWSLQIRDAWELIETIMRGSDDTLRSNFFRGVNWQQLAFCRAHEAAMVICQAAVEATRHDA